MRWRFLRVLGEGGCASGWRNRRGGLRRGFMSVYGLCFGVWLWRGEVGGWRVEGSVVCVGGGVNVR